jgi:predicted amidohydrolase
VIPTEKAKISILICYDLEFPEAARLVTLQGAEIILSPSATLSEAGYWRVRHCAQARCIEDQVYVVHSSLLGGVGLQGLEFWGNSSILTPCDVGYPRRGIAAEGSWNKEMIVSAELDIDLLHEVRERGAAPTLADRRRDLAERVCAEGSDRSR